MGTAASAILNCLILAWFIQRPHQKLRISKPQWDMLPPVIKVSLPTLGERLIFHTGFLNQRVRAEADLVVHFERETIDDPEYYRHLEGYLYGYDQADMVDYEFDPFRDGESGVPPTGDEAVEEAILHRA